jgi:serine/threonine-protein kinase ULK4
VHNESLPFEPWDPNQIASKIDTPEIETHLSDVYSALASKDSVNSQLNALNYFESIIINSNVSNRLINSAFMSLLVKMLKTIKTPCIKSRLCSVVGLLIRHSTVIENELAETKICEVLVETMRDKTDKVRRKAIAALGEYMFYAATQLDDEQVDPIWELSYESIQTILRCLRMNA